MNLYFYVYWLYVRNRYAGCSGDYQAVGHEKMTYIITLCRGTVYLAAKMFGLNKNPEGEIDEERIESVMLDKNENNLTELIEKIEVFCEKFEASARQNYYVTMVVEEICTAIMENAFTDKHKNMYILVTIIAEPESGTLVKPQNSLRCLE